jgi:hypothetical protein
MIIFLYSINQFVFLVETRCVFSEVGTEFLNTLLAEFVL